MGILIVSSQLVTTIERRALYSVCICEEEGEGRERGKGEREGERGREGGGGGRERERDRGREMTTMHILSFLPSTVFPTDQVIINGPEPVKLQCLLVVLCYVCHLIVALVTNNVVNKVQLAWWPTIINQQVHSALRH